MKKIYTLFALLLGVGLFAQNLSLVSMDDTVYSNPSWQFQDVYGKVKFKNNSNSTIYYKAKQSAPTCGLTGTRQICVGQLCYPPTVIETPDSFGVAANSIDSTFSGHIMTPSDGFEGCCPINYTFYDVNNPSDSVRVTMIFCTQRGLSVEDNVSSIEAVYPNPAKDFLNVKYNLVGQRNASFKLINVVGQVVLHEDLDKNSVSKRFDVSSLNGGVYFYSLVVDGSVIETKRLIIAD